MPPTPNGSCDPVLRHMRSIDGITSRRPGIRARVPLICRRHRRAAFAGPVWKFETRRRTGRAAGSSSSLHISWRTAAPGLSMNAVGSITTMANGYTRMERSWLRRPGALQAGGRRRPDEMRPVRVEVAGNTNAVADVEGGAPTPSDGCHASFWSIAPAFCN